MSPLKKPLERGKTPNEESLKARPRKTEVSASFRQERRRSITEGRMPPDKSGFPLRSNKMRRYKQLFHPQFFIRLQPLDRLGDTPGSRLLLLGVHNPQQVHPAMGRRQALEVLTSLWMGL